MIQVKIVIDISDDSKKGDYVNFERLFRNRYQEDIKLSYQVFDKDEATLTAYVDEAKAARLCGWASQRPSVRSATIS